MPLDDILKGVATSPAPIASTASSPSTISTSRSRRSCASTCASPAWARRPRATSATSSRCGARAQRRHPGPRLRPHAERRRDQGVSPTVPPPWVLKPRSQAAAIGHSTIAVGRGTVERPRRARRRRADYLLEQFIPGDVFHVDAIVWEMEVVLRGESLPVPAAPRPVAHGAGIFARGPLPPKRDSGAVAARAHLNARRADDRSASMRGVTHTEFIRARDGRWHFLETSARVGGAFIVDAGRGRDRHQPLARVGQASRSPVRQAPTSPAATRPLRRHRVVARPSGNPDMSATPTRRSSSASGRLTTPASSSRRTTRPACAHCSISIRRDSSRTSLRSSRLRSARRRRSRWYACSTGTPGAHWRAAGVGSTYEGEH